MQSSTSEYAEKIFEEYPELDTPVGREFVGTDEMDKQEYYLADITSDAKRLIIESDYSGDDREKRNFRTSGKEILYDWRTDSSYSLYTIPNMEDGSIAVITGCRIHTLEDLRSLIKDSRSIPVYIDDETNTMVMAIDSPDGTIHHGKKSNTHRDTYNGVILTRGLAKEKDGKAIIKNPYELTDEKIRSCDIKSNIEGKPFINISVRGLTKGQQEVLKKLEIGTLEDQINSTDTSKLIERAFQIKFGREPFVENVRDRVLETIEDAVVGQYWGEDSTGTILTPNTFIGEQIRYRDEFDSAHYRYYSLDDGSKEMMNMHISLLLNGEPVPVSVIVYEDQVSGNLLFITGFSHPDVDKCKQSYCKSGRLGFEDAKVLAEMNGELSIDIEALLNRPTINHLRLNLTLLDVNQATLTGVQNEIDLDKLVERYQHSFIDGGRDKEFIKIKTANTKPSQYRPMIH